ncbi:KRAB-A domain-containing protein 2-like [Clytia hemisphaerica]|uniref:KRAB-A domain-containing protein 2-like n=1 Tax=Clytia hemisphaerica TaxID=252671 RepID=UPI0034D44265
MEKVQIDLVVFEKTPSYRQDGKCFKYVLAILDVFSRFVFLHPLESKEPGPVMDKLIDIFLSVGYPKTIQSDRGNEFKGYVNSLCDKLNIPRPTSRAYHPQSQGKLERSHATWKKKLVYDISNNNLGNWCDELDLYAHQYNTGAHQGLGGISPFEVFYGRKLNDRIQEIETEQDDVDARNPDSNLQEWCRRVTEIREKTDAKSTAISKRWLIVIVKKIHHHGINWRDCYR